MDGGIRRGSDVVKALALGARAVMIGRAYLWGLAANGQAGVENVLDILRGGIDSALLGLGLSSIDELTPSTCSSPTASTGTLGVRPMRRRTSVADMTDAGRRDLARRRRACGPWSSCRSARSSSTGRTCRSTPTPSSPRPSPSAWRGAARTAPGSRPRSAYGASGEHQGFPGTLLDRHRGAAARASSSSSARVRRWAGRVVLVNGHGGNVAALRDAVEQLSAEGHDVAWVAVRHRGRRRCTPAAPRPP